MQQRISQLPTMLSNWGKKFKTWLSFSKTNLMSCQSSNNYSIISLWFNDLSSLKNTQHFKQFTRAKSLSNSYIWPITRGTPPPLHCGNMGDHFKWLGMSPTTCPTNLAQRLRFPQICSRRTLTPPPPLSVSILNWASKCLQVHVHPPTGPVNRNCS